MSAILLRSRAGFELLLPGAAGSFLAWAWHTWSAWQARRLLLQERYVEPWVRWRYAAMVAYGLLMLLTVCLLPLRGLILQAPILAALQVLLAIVALLLQYLTWCMPRRLRDYLNRGYQATHEDVELLPSDEELLRLPQPDTAANTTVA